MLLLIVVVLLLFCFNNFGGGSVVAGAAFCGVISNNNNNSKKKNANPSSEVTTIPTTTSSRTTTSSKFTFKSTSSSSSSSSSSSFHQKENNDNDNLQILYENEYMAVINKPPLVPCHHYDYFQQQSSKKSRKKSIKKKKKSYHHQNQQQKNDNHDGNINVDVDNNVIVVPTIIQRAYKTFPLLSKTQKIHLVHRLDVQTSGCLIIAFSSEVANILSQALSLSTSHKTYYAICRGNGDSLRQLCFDSSDNNYFMADGDVTDSKGIKRNAKTKIWGSMGSDNIEVDARRCCLVKCQPITGRYHQIRQHLGRLNYPIVGETRHHPDRTENKGWKKLLLLNNNNNNNDKLRLCLHCHRIQLSSSTTMVSSDNNDNDNNFNNNNNNNNNNNKNIDLHNNNNLKSILPPDGILDVSCPLPNDMKHIVDMTDWSKEARNTYPELFF